MKKQKAKITRWAYAWRCAGIYDNTIWYTGIFRTREQCREWMKKQDKSRYALRGPFKIEMEVGK